MRIHETSYPLQRQKEIGSRIIKSERMDSFCKLDSGRIWLRRNDRKTHTWPSRMNISFRVSFMTWLHKYLMSHASVTALPSSSIEGTPILCVLWLEKSISRPPLGHVTGKAQSVWREHTWIQLLLRAFWRPFRSNRISFLVVEVERIYQTFNG